MPPHSLEADGKGQQQQKFALVFWTEWEKFPLLNLLKEDLSG